jgi:hypothetical protein
MEGKRPRAAAMAALCVLFLLVLLLGQAAAQSQSEYCECFDGCYLSCRNDHHNPRWACIPSCEDACTIFTSQAGDGAAPCDCKTRICESSSAPAGKAQRTTLITFFFLNLDELDLCVFYF